MFRVLLLLVAGLSATSLVSAAAISVSPGSAPPGATIVVTLDDLVVDGSYRLVLDPVDPAGQTMVLREFTASDTEVGFRQGVPEDAANGAHELVLFRVATISVEVARRAFSVATPLAINLVPDSAEPGKAVRVTVTGTRTGSLTLDYAGERILGPVAVGDGSWSGRFIVPRDRPDSLPSTVKVVASNTIGRMVATRGATSFSALAPSGLPTFRATLSDPPPSVVEEGGLLEFSGRVQQPDGTGSSGRTSFVWKSSDGRVVPLDGGVETAPDGSYVARARAPSFFMDGVENDGSGEILSVVRDEDPDTGMRRDFVASTGFELGTTGAFEPGRGQFVIRLRGRNLLGEDAPIIGAYVAARQDLQGAFTDPRDGVPPPTDQDYLLMDNQFQATMESAGLDNLFWSSDGCPINFGAKRTNDLGEAVFEIDKDKLRFLTMKNALAELGETRVVDAGNPVPGVDVFEQGIGGGLRKGAAGQEAYVTIEIYAGSKGFGETGQHDDGQWHIVPTYVPIAVDLQTGEVRVDGPIGQFGETSGSMTSPGVVTVDMERINLEVTGEIVPFNLRIDGLSTPTGDSPKFFWGMDTFPDRQLWPDSVFSAPNSGRMIRFDWDVGFGSADNPRLELELPDGTYFADFAINSDQACTLEGEFTFSAPLPDLTRLPVPQPPSGFYAPPRCYAGRVTVDRIPTDAVQEFRLCTRRPPADMTVQNTGLRPGSLRIDALRGTYHSELDMPDSDPADTTVDDPKMRDYGLPPQENASNNDASVSYANNSTGQRTRDAQASTEHLAMNLGTEAIGVSNPGIFGFSGNQAVESDIVREEVLDTGRIRLFTYPWGFSPIAGATVGADFWMSADVAFYGTVGNPGGEGSLMDATIDPRIRGGIDLFFDLTVLGGMISATAKAMPELGLTLREIIGDGGLPNQTSGTCAYFSLKASLEICGLWIFCWDDVFDLFSADAPNGCAPLVKDGRPKRGDFDLPNPRIAPADVATDGYGRTLVVRVDADQRLLAEHLESNQVAATRVIDAQTHGVQNISVVHLGADRALAVWSESRLSTTEIRRLLTPSASLSNPVRESTDDLVRNLGLRHAWWDGTAWSAPDWIPGVQADSVGLPRLAACKSTFSFLGGCLRGAGEAYLVWQHDAAGDINAPKLEVWGMRFTPGGGFGAATQLSAASGTQDILPAVAYLGSEPLVAWTSTPGPAYGEAAMRAIAYRIVDGERPRNPVRLLPGSSGAGWAAVATRNPDEVLFAFTRAQDQSLFGNRQALTVAKGRCTSGLCDVKVTEPRDVAGRQIRGEAPSVSFGENGEAVVQLRALGFGTAEAGSIALASDSVGTLLGTGDLMELRVDDFRRSTARVATRNLTANGLLHMRPRFVYDTAADAFVGISHQVEMPALRSETLDAARKIVPHGFSSLSQPKALGGEGLMLHTVTPAPDFRIESAIVDSPWLEPGQSMNYTVRVRNAGSAYDPAIHGTAMLAVSWDAPPGAGIDAGTSLALSGPLAANEVRTLVGTVLADAQHFRDQRRTVYFELQAPAETPDADTVDNLTTQTIGAMPVPQGLVARTKPDLGAIGLDWETAADPRVAGYRVYKRAENGEFVPYGSSPASGYIDVFAGFRNVEEYRITSFSDRGIESEPSAAVMVAPQQSAGIFGDSFEPAE